jgi:hypothetical protein
MSAPPTVVASGSPTTLGEAHGAALRSEIHQHLGRWKQMLTAIRGEDADVLIHRFVNTGRFRGAIEQHTPWLIDEVAAIGSAADLAADDTWFLQLMDESWQQQSLFRREHCTAFGVVEGSRSWSGQTMDLEPFRHGAQAVLDLHPDDQFHQQIVTMAGSIGLLGMSAGGFAVSVNALAQVPTRDDGLPVLFMIRGALAQDDAAAAEAFIRETPHATGQAYMIAGTRSVVSLECSALGVVESMSGERKRWHTNHPLVGYVPEPDDQESELRGEAARQALVPISFARSRAQDLLCRPPIRRALVGDGADGDDLFTFAASVFELRDGTDPVMLLNLPDDPAAWHEFTMPRVRLIDRRQKPATITPP